MYELFLILIYFDHIWLTFANTQHDDASDHTVRCLSRGSLGVWSVFNIKKCSNFMRFLWKADNITLNTYHTRRMNIMKYYL